MFQNIPYELRQLRQWVAAGADKIPLNPRTGQAASSVDPSTWGDFDTAVQSGYKHIGFVLTDYDPYCIIDLDNKPEKPLTNEEWVVHERILNAFDTYTERSASGRGYHIVVKAKLAKGRRKENVEIYSNERYMIFTGDVVRNSPIIECQSLVDTLITEMMPTAKAAELEQIDSDIPDWKVVDRASNAKNGEKFDKLCNGDFLNDYPSQSEADFALMSMICFYSKDNEQCRRIFRMTKLGKRDKAQRDSYLDYAIGKIRGNEVPRVNFEELSLRASEIANLHNSDIIMQDVAIPPHPANMVQGLVPPPPRQRVPSSEIHIDEKLTQHALKYPPGLIGDLAEYFYATAIRPVREIALAAAIGLTAGVCSRAYNISGTGLNQYIILLAKTGSGKEGAMKGISNLISAVRPQVPTVDQFIGPAAFSSGQALVKVLGDKPCFVSVLGEFGLTLQEMSSSAANSSQKMLKKVLLDLYNKSGHGEMLLSSVYSDTEKNTKAVASPSVTILGESTPETFFEGLDQSHIAEGLIPRFTMIEYTGKRPARNRNSNCPPPQALVQRFSELLATSLTIQNKMACAPVQMDTEAMHLLDAFDTYADDAINATNNDVEAQLWNRGHLKALRIAGLLAVGVNAHQPIVTVELAQWAVEFVYADIKVVSEKFKTGDVGHGDSKQDADMRHVIRQFKNITREQMDSYGVPTQMYVDGVIPFSYISRRLSAIASFRKDRLGSRRAISDCIKSFVDQNVLIEIDKMQCQERYGMKWICYGVGNNFK